VVFVCEHGAAKSVIAAAYFNKLASERGLNATAISRGTAPDPQFSTATVAGLKSDGFAAPGGQPQLLGAADVQAAAVVVTLGAELPRNSTPAKRREWNDTPSVSANYGAARDSIRGHVESLVEELSKKPAH
jgi:protein-tyrosine-phosphatase